MLIFWGGVFLVTCRSELPILTPLKGGNARHFFVGCLPTAILRFLTLKRRGNAREFFRGCFLVPFRFQIDLSGDKWTFPAPKLTDLAPERFILVLGGSLGQECPISTSKRRGNARQFVVGCFLVPFRFQMDLSGSKLDRLWRRKGPFLV